MNAVMNGEMRPMATRESNACREFVETVVEQFGYTTEQAETILAVYRKLRAVKIDRHIGRVTLSHGDLWTRDAMNRALALA
jgi:hypothetical protein